MRLPRHLAGLDRTACAALAMRGAAVGGNFAVMLWLVGWLGLTAFGQIMHQWAIAMVLATIVSMGGPVLVLREAGAGDLWRRAMAPPLVLGAALACPAVLAGLVPL